MSKSNGQKIRNIQLEDHGRQNAFSVWPVYIKDRPKTKMGFQEFSVFLL